MKKFVLLSLAFTFAGLLWFTGSACSDDDDDDGSNHYFIPVNASVGSPEIEFEVKGKSIGSVAYPLAGWGEYVNLRYPDLQIKLKVNGNVFRNLAYDDNVLEHKSVYAYGNYPNTSISVLSDEYPSFNGNSGVRLINLNPAYSHINLIDTAGNIIQSNRVYEGDTNIFGTNPYYHFKQVSAGVPQLTIVDSETNEIIEQTAYEVDPNIGVTVFLAGNTKANAQVGYVWHD